MIAMLLVIGVLWLADGGDPSAVLNVVNVSQVSLQSQISDWLSVSLAATEESQPFPTGMFAILFIVGAALAFLWSRIGGDSDGNDGKKQLAPHYHLPVLYKVQAKDLDAS